MKGVLEILCPKSGGIKNATKKWNMPVRNWNLTLSQLAIFLRED